ncbi:MAG: agmatinase [SAR202 cluster bacterium]|nr:agmatinase [SAR202 cluster bacterium]
MPDRTPYRHQGPPAGRYWPTFLTLSPEEADYDSARVVLVPVPYDGTTSYMGGARYGPRAIIAASAQMEDFDPELGTSPSDAGIFTAPELVPDVSGPQAVIASVRDAVAPHVQRGKLVGVLGGEHSITVGAVQATVARFPDLSVLYLDAHADLRDEYMGSRWSHACAARRVLEHCPVTHVGVRSLSVEEHGFIRERELPVTMWPPHSGTGADLASRVIGNLSPNVYVTIDLDVLDPSLMAAVGTPEPGGMQWADVAGLLRAVSMERNIVGFDVVELSPREGPEACAYTAAKLVYKLIGYACGRMA